MLARLRFVVLVVSICSGSIFGADPVKPVKRVWFPRFSMDGRLLATAHGGWDAKEGGEVRIWEAATGMQKHLLREPRGVRSVAFSPNATLLAAGGYGQTISLYHTESGKQIRTWSAVNGVENLMFHPDGRHLFVSHGNGAVCIWDSETGTETQEIAGIHKGEIWGMTTSPDGKLVATAGQDNTVNITNVETGRHPPRFPRPGSNGVAFSSDGKRLASGGVDSLIRIYDIGNGAELQTLKGHQSGSISDLQFGANDQILVSAGMDQTVRVWDLSDSQAPKLKQTLTGHQDFVFGVALSPDGKLLASGGWDDRIQVWDTQSFQEKWSWDRAKAK